MRWFNRQKSGGFIPPQFIGEGAGSWEDWQPMIVLTTAGPAQPIPIPVYVHVRANDKKALAQTAVIHATYVALLSGRQPVTS